MAGRLDGKVALVTGTGGGQGRAAALRFCAEGAKVVGCDVKIDGNAETVSMARAAGGEMTGMAPVDLGDAAEAAAWVDAAAAVHGRVDVLYNNASAPRFGPIEEYSIDDWDFTIRNELDIIYYVTKPAWKYLKERGGVIVNTASVSGWIGSKGMGGFAHNATKGGVLALTRGLAVEGAPHGIRVVSISPGPIETPATAELFAIPEVRAAMLERQLLPRLGLPDDIANMATFLASDEAAYITGSDHLVDGGTTAI